MSWTDDRVARLSKLWAEGLSASQIAADLGGVTRNAVIGKVHRLGLSGRVKPASGGSKPRRKPSAPRAKYIRNSSRIAGGARTAGGTALKTGPDGEVALRERPVEDIVVPISRQLNLMQLTDTTCKWPTGDPTMPGFSFCGHKSADDKPYCEFHSKLAFQPANERRRRR